MRRMLITGAGGFVAKHFMDFLYATKQKIEVLGVDVLNSPKIERKSRTVRTHFRKMNLLEREAVDKIVLEFKPDRVLHLASFSSVGYSWEKPVESFCNNTNIFLNLVESLRTHCPKAQVLSVGSSEEYGEIKKNHRLTESDPLNPSNPYGVARVSQEMLAAMYAKSFAMNIVLTRSFNHLGTGQRPDFVVPSFIRQFVLAKQKGNRMVDIRAGNIHITRDFTNVKDVVRAYDLLLERGRAGEIYNVCSGHGVSLKEIISLLEDIVKIKASIIVDKSLVRPRDLARIVGDYTKIHSETGWKPKIPLRNTLAEMVQFYSI